MAVMLHGSGIAGLDMAAATIKMNDDGSFNLLIGATRHRDRVRHHPGPDGSGGAGRPGVADIIVYSSDTDFTPFDKGAYASSTTYISGGAVRKAALQVAEQIKAHAASMMGLEDIDGVELRDRRVFLPDGVSLTLAQVALSSLHQQDQHQIMATASHMSYESPPPFAAQFVEVSRRYRDRPGHRRAGPDGGGCGTGDQPGHRLGAGGGGPAAGHRLRALRGDGLR